MFADRMFVRTEDNSANVAGYGLGVGLRMGHRHGTFILLLESDNSGPRDALMKISSLNFYRISLGCLSGFLKGINMPESAKKAGFGRTKGRG